MLMLANVDSYTNKMLYNGYKSAAEEGTCALFLLIYCANMSCVKPFRMAVSHSGQSSLVQSLATLLRNDGMLQCDAQNTHYSSVVKYQIRSGDKSELGLQFNQNNSRELCVSGCSHSRQALINTV